MHAWIHRWLVTLLVEITLLTLVTNAIPLGNVATSYPQPPRYRDQFGNVPTSYPQPPGYRDQFGNVPTSYPQPPGYHDQFGNVPTSYPKPPRYRGQFGTDSGPNDLRPVNNKQEYSQEELDEVLNKVKAIKNKKKLARIGKRVNKINKPKSWLGKLFERILNFLRRKRRTPPAVGVLEQTKAVGQASVAPVVTGISLGILSTWVLCASARIADVFRIIP
ncbi:hypothetical protein PtB15_7B109 [Puccinia triticina]|nr:hypothetical protein PtB15_7B109 [Puccinia triticina]